MPPRVEELAQRLVRYLILIDENSEQLQKSLPPSRVQEYYHQMEREPWVVGDNDNVNWEPAPGEREAYLDEMDRIIDTTPSTSPENCMKVLFAAHAASMCITMCILPDEPHRIQKHVLPRVSQLHKEYMEKVNPDPLDDDSDWECEYKPFTTSAIAIGAQTRPVSEAEWHVMSANPVIRLPKV